MGAASDFDHALSRWSTGKARKREAEDLRAGREVVEEQGEHVCERRVTHEHEQCHGWRISVE